MIGNEVRLSDLIAPQFYTVHNAVKTELYGEFWLKGGRGSTKSAFVALQIIKGIMADPDANCLATRKVGATVRKSVMETLLWAIDALGVSQYFRRTVSPAEITYIPTGQQIIMVGLDDPQKLKSIKIRRGYFKFLWFEEGAEFSGMEEIRSVEQSVMRGGDKFVEFVSYNPPKDPEHWINKEAANPKASRMIHHSTYLGVPREWNGERFFAEAEMLKERDFLAYDNEYMGNPVGRLDQVVFNGKWEVVNEIDEAKVESFYFGADWGFSIDPTTLIRMFVRDGNLYITHEAYAARVEMEELGRMFDLVPNSRDYEIRADSARPETISYMNRQGFTVIGAGKGKGSVEDGIEYLRGTFKKIVIHSRCEHVIHEMKNYSYKVDKYTLAVLPILAAGNDHCIDAIRYALEPMIKKQELFMDIL